MSLFQTAARLNNDAVSLLQSGNHKKSVETFAESIKLMKQLLSNSATHVKELHSSSSTRCFTVELSMQEEHDNFVFHQAFQIPEDNEEAVRDVHVHTAAVIFNLALAHHLHSTTKHNAGDLSYRQICLDKAERLYNMTLKILHSRNCQNSQTQTGLIVKLACINNLSLIGFNVDGSLYDLAREALHSFSVFASAVGASTDTVNSEIFGQAPIQGLVMNVLLLKAPKVAPAA